MKAPNVNSLNLERMLDRAETTTAVMRVVYNLQNISDYKKEDAAQELLNFLESRGYLGDPLTYHKDGENDE